jgi:D-alanyl-D-alanine carboxypeptidase (penicillin-binding protein 5/6)
MMRRACLLALATGLLLGISPLARTAIAFPAPAVPPLAISASFPSGEPQPPDITSPAALVIDVDSGLVLYSKDADQRLPMASTTKIMTAILVLESLDLNTKVTVSRNAHFQSGSVVGLQQGEVVTVEQLLYCLLVFSGNDAAVALAEQTSGSVAKFVAKMNERAKAMGLTNTHFANPDGLNASNHYSSCTDLATMARFAMQNALFRRIVDTPVYYLPHPTYDVPRELKNSNVLLTQYAWVNGIKTGSTPYAGYCMVASGTRDGVSLMVVLLGAADEPTRWSEVDALFKYGFGLCPRTVLAEPGRLVLESPLGDPLGLRVRLVPHELLTTRLRKGEMVTGVVSLFPELSLPIHAGDLLGSVQFTLNGEALGSVDLFAERAVYPPTLQQILAHARNWPLPDFEVSDRGERFPH